MYLVAGCHNLGYIMTVNSNAPIIIIKYFYSKNAYYFPFFKTPLSALVLYIFK